MRVELTNRFTRKYRKAPEEIQTRIDKALRFLSSDVRHPSLRSKIVDEQNRIWQARISRSWRMLYQVTDEHIIALTVFPHKD